MMILKKVNFEYRKPADKFFNENENLRAKFEAEAKQIIYRDHPEQVNYKPLHGRFKGYSRIAIGSYRIIYKVINGEIIVVNVEYAGSRGDVYKKFKG